MNRNLIVLAMIFMIVLSALLFVKSDVTMTFDSPIATPHPPCPPDYSPQACDEAWANLPQCNRTICPLGCVSRIYCVECDESGSNCWASAIPWYTNTLNIPRPLGPVSRTWWVYVPFTRQ